jgi:hypothetical protein
MAEQLVNRAATFLANPINATQTLITVSGYSGFPTGGNFRIIVENELMLVTAGGNGSFNWTVTRGIEGTTAAPHIAAIKLTAVLTAGGLIQYLSENYTPL